MGVCVCARVNTTHSFSPTCLTAVQRWHHHASYSGAGCENSRNRRKTLFQPCAVCGCVWFCGQNLFALYIGRARCAGGGHCVTPIPIPIPLPAKGQENALLYQAAVLLKLFGSQKGRRKSSQVFVTKAKGNS